MKRSLIAALALVLAPVACNAAGHAVSVTIHDARDGAQLPVYRHGGRLYVAGKPGREYRVRLRNRTGAEVLAVLSVDGVNAVSGETASWDQTGYVLGPYQSFDVAGWRKSLDRVAAFYFTRHENSYAARTDRPDNVGVIGVAVFRKTVERPAILPREERGPWPESAAPSSEDALAKRGERAHADGAGSSIAAQRHSPASPRAEKSIGTGHGRSVASRVTYTEFERATPHPEEVVVIHYDTHANLVAAGVIPAPRIATPFPGQFVPDPR